MADVDKIIKDGTQLDIADSAARQPTFTEASTRANIASGETLSTLFGKIKKWFTDLKTVAFTGAYSDLTGLPTIPTVNNATLTIQKNGTTVKTFTANASSNKTANIIVPTKTSELTNDSGFVDATTGTKTTITGNNANVTLDSNYCKYIIKAGVCYVTLSVKILADGSQDVTTNLPNSAFGDYMYMNNINATLRVNAYGNLRFTRSNSDAGSKNFSFSYPVA